MKQPCSLLCGLIIFLSLAACTVIGPTPTAVPTATAVPTPIAEEVCGAECISSLHIKLDGAVPQEFELELTWGGGHTDRVRCVDGETQAEECGQNCVQIRCRGTAGDPAASWYGWLGAPNSVTVTVTWDGNQIVEHIEPNYGEVVVCDYLCYDADVTITLPESP